MQAARSAPSALTYQRHQPEQTLLYQLVAQHYPLFRTRLAEQGRPLPHYIQQEFEAFLRCGRLEHGFLRVRCESCQHEKLVAFSCKKRGFCPSCGARRMVESAALLLDEVLPEVPIRQWVLSFPFQLRFLLARFPELTSQVLRIVYRAIAADRIKQAGCTQATAHTGAVTLIQRFGSALNLNLHLHMLFLDGVYAEDDNGNTHFHRTKPPTTQHPGTHHQPKGGAVFGKARLAGARCREQLAESRARRRRLLVAAARSLRDVSHCRWSQPGSQGINLANGAATSPRWRARTQREGLRCQRVGVLPTRRCCGRSQTTR